MPTLTSSALHISLSALRLET